MGRHAAAAILLATTLGSAAGGPAHDGAPAPAAQGQGGAGNYQQYVDSYRSYLKGQGQGQAGSGDYSQHMDYQKYMRGGQGQNRSGAGGYQQYTDYSTYMQGQGQGQNQSGAGGYQQYMDYQKYMQGQSQGGGAGDYSKYYQKYMQGQSQGGGDGDYSKYYQTYMQGQGQNQSGASGYQQYMDYQKYIQGGQGQNESGAGGYQQYMNYQTYMQGQGGQDMAGGYSQYMDYQKYMQGQGGKPTSLLARNASTELLALNGSAPATAADCNTTSELRAWRDGQLARIAKWVPKGYRHFAEAPVQQEFRRNLARIAGTKPEATPAPVPKSAADCETEDQLEGWRKKQEARISQYVPAPFRRSAVRPVEQDYRKNLARLRAARSVQREAAVEEGSRAGAGGVAAVAGAAPKAGSSARVEGAAAAAGHAPNAGSRAGAGGAAAAASEAPKELQAVADAGRVPESGLEARGKRSQQASPLLLATVTHEEKPAGRARPALLAVGLALPASLALLAVRRRSLAAPQGTEAPLLGAETDGLRGSDIC